MAIKKKQLSITEAALLPNISRQAVDSAIRRGALKAPARTKKVTETVWCIPEQSLGSLSRSSLDLTAHARGSVLPREKSPLFE